MDVTQAEIDFMTVINLIVDQYKSKGEKISVEFDFDVQGIYVDCRPEIELEIAQRLAELYPAEKAEPQTPNRFAH